MWFRRCLGSIPGIFQNGFSTKSFQNASKQTQFEIWTKSDQKWQSYPHFLSFFLLIIDPNRAAAQKRWKLPNHIYRYLKGMNKLCLKFEPNWMKNGKFIAIIFMSTHFPVFSAAIRNVQSRQFSYSPSSSVSQTVL